jgi:hypothetical protein
VSGPRASASISSEDLTQTALGFSRDDAEKRFVPTYVERKVFDCSPFETIDEPGVGWLVRLASWGRRSNRPTSSRATEAAALETPPAEALIAIEGHAALLDLGRVVDDDEPPTKSVGNGPLRQRRLARVGDLR